MAAKRCSVDRRPPRPHRASPARQSGAAQAGVRSQTARLMVVGAPDTPGARAPAAPGWGWLAGARDRPLEDGPGSSKLGNDDASTNTMQSQSTPAWCVTARPWPRSHRHLTRHRRRHGHPVRAGLRTSRLTGITTVAGNVRLDKTTANAAAAGVLRRGARDGGRRGGPPSALSTCTARTACAGCRCRPRPGRPQPGRRGLHRRHRARGAARSPWSRSVRRLTNVALALRREPALVGAVRDYVIMGGSTTRGNVAKRLSSTSPPTRRRPPGIRGGLDGHHEWPRRDAAGDGDRRAGTAQRPGPAGGGLAAGPAPVRRGP